MEELSLEANSSSQHVAKVVHVHRQINRNVFHKGHEHLHNYIAISLIIVIFTFQFVLWYWKKNHLKSFKRVTLFGVWIVPPIICYIASFWRMLFFWLLYTIFTIKIFLDLRSEPLDKNTPRRVYSFFLFVFKLSYGAAVTGYTFLLVEFLGFSMITPLAEWVAYYSILLIFYGVYFGLLGRDTAELCADRMTVALGYGNDKKSLPRKTTHNACAVCGLGLLAIRDESRKDEPILKLNCGDSFHEACLRGWIIVGKKKTCPSCSEKVEFDASLYTHPWLKTSLLWTQLLDALGFLVVWNPLLVLLIQTIVYYADRPNTINTTF